MNMLILLGILAASGWLLALQQFTRATRASARASESEERIEKLLSKSVKRKEELARLRPIAEAAGRSVAEIERDRDTQAKLAQERFELLEGVIQEKQVVWRMYRDSTRQAGVAQNWLLREYSSALQALNHYRRKAGEPEISAPAQLAALVAEFTAAAQKIPDLPPTEVLLPTAPGAAPGAAESPA